MWYIEASCFLYLNITRTPCGSLDWHNKIEHASESVHCGSKSLVPFSSAAFFCGKTLRQGLALKDP
jgi:hypothetical protein